jgi:dihydroflavonol-4-reductase
VNAFVTGATGFIGSHLVDLLVARGARVSCLVRQPSKARLPAGVRLVAGSLADEAALRAAAEKADAVFHLAGRVGAWRPSTLDEVNRAGTARVLEAVARVAPSAHFVHLSSLSAAGPSQRGTPRVESDPDAPVSAYGRSKLSGEGAVKAGPVRYTILRPPAVYGPRDRAFLPLFRLARHGIAPIAGDPDQELSLVEVHDLVRAIACVVTPRCAGLTLYASHPAIVTAAGFATLVHEALARHGAARPRHRLVTVPLPLAAVSLAATGAWAAVSGRVTPLVPGKLAELRAPGWTCSPRALTLATGWRGQTSLADGLARTASWYAQNRHL